MNVTALDFLKLALIVFDELADACFTAENSVWYSDRVGLYYSSDRPYQQLLHTEYGATAV